MSTQRKWFKICKGHVDIDGPNSDFLVEHDVLMRYTGPAKTVTMPDAVTGIGHGVFSNYSSVASIGDTAFSL